MRLTSLLGQVEHKDVERRAVFRLIDDDRGVTMIEYALIAALIGLAVAALLSTIGDEVIVPFSTIANNL